MNKMLEDLAEVVAEITPRSPGGPWVAANFIRTHHAEIAQNAEAAKRLHICWGKEVDDIDKIVEKLGLTVEQARTDGGCLHLPRILNHIQETLDALAVSTDLAGAMSDKYVASNKQLNEAAKRLEAAERDAARWRYLVSENNKGMHGKYRICWLDPRRDGFITTDGVSCDGKDEQAIVRIIDAAM